MNTLKTIAISVLTTIVSIIGAYNYLPLGVDEPTFGATITTIQGSDTLRESRTTINNNFSALNNAKVEISDLAATTSLTNLAELGTITTAIWNADTLTVPYGGTGSTTLPADRLLLGNGTDNINAIFQYGTDGQFLTSNGTGTAPTWQTSAVDQAIDYTWTGLHIWNTAGAIFNASTTFAGNVSLATSSVLLRTDANGKIVEATEGIHYRLPAYTYASTTNISTSSISCSNSCSDYGYASSTGSVLTIPAGTLTGSSTIEFRVTGYSDFGTIGSNSRAWCYAELRTASGATLSKGVFGRQFSTGSDLMGHTTASIIFDTQSTQTYISQNTYFQDQNNDSMEGTASVDFSSEQELVVVVEGEVQSATGELSEITSCNIYGYTIVVNP